ncbi:MAG: hypothetical protein ACR2HG_15665 [Pyrinomonadaceae bacterium]
MSVPDSFPPPEDNEYWHSRTPAERLENVKRLRRTAYGEAAIKGIDKSAFEIAEIDWE